MRATDCLIKQRDAAEYMAGTGGPRQDKKYEFTVRLCNELLRAINNDVKLNDQQAEFLAERVSSVGYEFIPGSGGSVKYDEMPWLNTLMVVQIATYINSCK